MGINLPLYVCFRSMRQLRAWLRSVDTRPRVARSEVWWCHFYRLVNLGLVRWG